MASCPLSKIWGAVGRPLLFAVAAAVPRISVPSEQEMFLFHTDLLTFTLRYLAVKKEVPANVYATNLNFVYLRIADNERLRNHSFTLELEFAGFATENPNRAIFRRKAWLDDAHTYDYFGPQTFGCTGEQGSGGSFQGYPPEAPWTYPEPKHVEFEGSLDHVISHIDTTSGAFLIKVRNNGMFSDNRILPALNVLSYRGEISLDWKIMLSILFKKLEAGQRLREIPESCNSIAEMMDARPLCPFSNLVGPNKQCYCRLD